MLYSFISPAHTRTEGRTPVWGSEFTSKDAALQGGGPAETAARLNVKLCFLTDWWWWSQLTPKKEKSQVLFFIEFYRRINKESSLTVLRRGNARHRAKHATTRFPRQRCRRPTPRSCAAGANGKNMCQWWSAIAPRKPDILTLPLCTSAESFTSGCNSVAALALTSCNEHVAEENVSRPLPLTSRVLCTLLTQCSKLERSEKQLNFLVQETCAHGTCISMFPGQSSTRISYIFPPPRPFSPACSPPPSCFFARDWR